MLVLELEDTGHVIGTVTMLVDKIIDPSINALVAEVELGYLTAVTSVADEPAPAITVYPNGKSPSFVLAAVQTVTKN